MKKALPCRLDDARTMILQDRVAIVTGSASGIGRASALTFAKEGAKVLLVDLDEVQGEQVAREIHENGQDAFFVQADVSKEAEIIHLIGLVIERWKRIDILFNNAGIVLAKSVEETSEAEWDRVMSVNVKAAFLMIKHAVPHMRPRGGAILNTGSIASLTGQFNTPAYSASKGAIALLTKSLALDYGRDRIRVNCICPGITDTPMLRQHLGDGPEGKARIGARLSRVPSGEIVSPFDVARAALYLVSDESKGISGILHVVDGGLLAAAEYDVPITV
jgi:NAD(P)-dependent dehydrogenase (short-subunit alcohol dehydrogenase family)